MKFLKWTCPVFKRKIDERNQLRFELDKNTKAWAVERSVLIDEITRNKHMLGVYRQMFSNIETFNNTFSMMQASLTNLLSKTVQNSKYAIVAEVEMVKVEHLMFKLNMYKKFVYLHDLSELEPYLHSPFGIWYYGEGQKLSTLKEFIDIDQHYQSMYVYAAEALELLREGEYVAGVEKVSKMEQCSGAIVNLLEYIASHLMDSIHKEEEIV